MRIVPLHWKTLDRIGDTAFGGEANRPIGGGACLGCPTNEGWESRSGIELE